VPNEPPRKPRNKSKGYVWEVVYDQPSTIPAASFSEAEDQKPSIKQEDPNLIPVDSDKMDVDPQNSETSMTDAIREALALEDHLEREFWRMVESPLETVEVEYGADVHATKWGRYVTHNFSSSMLMMVLS
jgi:hypothetical protein